MLLRVMPEHVTALWPQLEVIFAPALAIASTHDAEDVRKALMSGQAQLWCQMDGAKVEAAATTEFVNYPKGVFVRVWHAGARKDAKMDIRGFYEIIDRWRIAHGCRGLEVIGRHGWLRGHPTARVEGLIMRIVQ